jgi:hypothetical protein
MNRAICLLMLLASLGCSRMGRGGVAEPSHIAPPQMGLPPAGPQAAPQGRGAILRQKNQETMEEIAIAELSKSQGKELKRSKFDVSSTRVGVDWHVTISSKPAKPGGFSTVILSQTGELKAIVGGE